MALLKILPKALHKYTVLSLMQSTFVLLIVFNICFQIHLVSRRLDQCFCSISISYHDIMQQAVLVTEHSTGKLHFIGQPLAESAYEFQLSKKKIHWEEKPQFPEVSSTPDMIFVSG